MNVNLFNTVARFSFCYLSVDRGNLENVALVRFQGQLGVGEIESFLKAYRQLGATGAQRYGTTELLRVLYHAIHVPLKQTAHRRLSGNPGERDAVRIKLHHGPADGHVSSRPRPKITTLAAGQLAHAKSERVGVLLCDQDLLAQAGIALVLPRRTEEETLVIFMAKKSWLRTNL